MTINAVYNAKILDFAGNIPRIGKLNNPDASAKAHSKLCGSTVQVDINTDGETITDYAHDVKACALGQAAAAILATHVVGSTLPELKLAQQELRAMLKEDGPIPSGRFAELEFLLPVKEYRARHASTMLAFDAVVDAMQQVLEPQSA